MIRPLIVRRWMFCVLTIGVLVSTAVSSARAAIALRSYATVQTSGNGIIFNQKYDYDDTGLRTFSGSAITPGMSLKTRELSILSEQHLPSNSALAQSWIETEVGAFHALLHGTAQTSSGAVSASSYTYGEWQDNVKILSDTLPVGTPVRLTATISVDRTINVSPGESWYVSVYSPYVRYDDYSYSRNPLSTATGFINTSIGSTLSLWQTFNAHLQPTADTPGSVSGTLDLSHTSNFYLDGGEHVSFQADSGYSYAPLAAVPEPASLIVWSVLGLAVAGGTFLRRRKAT